jgi:hypothetical protein
MLPSKEFGSIRSRNESTRVTNALLQRRLTGRRAQHPAAIIGEVHAPNKYIEL